MKRKEFVIFGVGDFGMNVAKTLANSGATVMVVDKEESQLEKIASEVTHTICADATNPEAMKQLGIRNYDGAIVGIGHNLETSALITMQLKEMDVPFIMVKASTDIEGRILTRVGADKVIFPDREMGIRVGNDIINGNYFEAIELSDEYSIVDMTVPTSWVGKTLQQLNVRSKYGISIIGIRGLEELNVNPAADYRLLAQDILIVLGHNTEIQRLREIKE
ncbi:MAG: TrkA family potassium uptake protein [Eubacterium sp.]|nr:TrkA family potassium uptake protein [Eubacterium sp.]